MGYNRLVRAPLIAGLLLAACATVKEKPETPRVEQLRIEGVSKLDEAELKAHLSTGQSGPLPPWVPFANQERRLDPSAWQADLRRIERFYQARGYYQARVVDESIELLGDDSVALSVRVEEGPLTTLSELTVTGLEELPQEHRAQVLSGLPMEKGAPFLEDTWAEVKGTLAARLRELGYAEVVIKGEARVDLATHTAQATLAVDPGPRFRFGKILVASNANARVGARRIIEQVENELKPGEWYSEAVLARAQARVFQMGVFGAVKVNRSAPDRQGNTVPVVVDVREAPFHTLQAGVGFGFDQSRQELRVSGEYTDRNFYGGLRRLTTRGKVGYAFLPDAFSVFGKSEGSKSGVVGSLTTELEQPRLFLPSLSGATSLELSSGIEPAYDFIGGSYKVGLVWRPRTDLTFYPSYNLEIFRLSSPAPLDGRAPAVTFGCPLTCVLSYLEQTVEFDRRDDRFEPRRGYYLALSLQEGGGPLGGAFTYLRLLPEARGYVSFLEGARLTLAGKLKVGTLLTSSFREPGPIVSRFFSGGGTSMRGFDTRRLSPLLAVPREEGSTSAETLPQGGKGLLEASTEARYNLFGSLVLATFLDAGFVTSRDFDFTNPAYLSDHLLLAAGIGLRLRTPLGPIRADFARRLPVGPPLEVYQGADRSLTYPSNGSCFGLGGNGSTEYAGAPEGLCTFHISIGEAF